MGSIRLVMATLQSIQPVISEAAEQWLFGGLHSEDYFRQAREAASVRAVAAVELRLQRRDPSLNSVRLNRTSSSSHT